MNRSALIVVLSLLVFSSSAIGETEAERAERIRAAAEALNNAKAEAETPAALKAQIAKLEAENRALRVELVKMRAAMKEAGIAVGGAADDEDDRVRSLSTFKQFVSLLPDEVLPRRAERSNREAWTTAVGDAICNWYFDNRHTYNFRNLKVRVSSTPSPSGYQVGEDGWYRMRVEYTLNESSALSVARTLEHDGTYWLCSFEIFLKPKNEKQRRLILDLKDGDTFTIDAEIPMNYHNGKPFTFRDSRLGFRTIDGKNKKNKRVFFVGLGALLEVTDFR